MNYAVILDTVAHEIEDLLRGNKSMIIHGADEINIPYGIIEAGDVFYFFNDNDRSAVKAKGIVSSVYNSCKLSMEESYEMIIRNQHKLRLPDDLFYKWAGKKYLVLIGLKDVEEVNSLVINKSLIIKTVDWLPTKNNDDLLFHKFSPSLHLADESNIIIRLPVGTSGAA